jgi:hypothetical protein
MDNQPKVSEAEPRPYSGLTWMVFIYLNTISVVYTGKNKLTLKSELIL